MFTITRKYANGKTGTELAKPQKISTIYITDKQKVPYFANCSSKVPFSAHHTSSEVTLANHMTVFNKLSW